MKEKVAASLLSSGVTAESIENVFLAKHLQLHWKKNCLLISSSCMALGYSAFDGNVRTEWFVRSDLIACILKEVFGFEQREREREKGNCRRKRKRLRFGHASDFPLRRRERRRLHVVKIHREIPKILHPRDQSCAEQLCRHLEIIETESRDSPHVVLSNPEYLFSSFLISSPLCTRILLFPRYATRSL